MRYPAIASAGGAKEISSAYTTYADNEVNGLLSQYFTVPFSSNNITAVDLSVDLTYARVGVSSIKDADKIRERVYTRIENIKDGVENMMLIDGTVVQSLGEPVFSSDEGYHHTFGVDHVEHMHVDSSQTYAEDQERNF
jgi:hypothetical protein